MYAKNAASPEPIAIGAVVQISDGAVQTTGCTVRIKPIGVAEGDGGGTTAYSTDGIVYYTPTQAETNYTSFILIAKKTGCIPVALTVVTTASSVPGRTMPADGSVTAAVIANGAIDAATFAADVDAEILSYIVDDATRIDATSLNTATVTSIPAILDDTGTAGVVVASASKTGYTLTATTGLGNQTADITGTITTATNVTTVNGIGANVVTASALATDAVNEIVDQVWDEIMSGHAGVGSTGAALSAAGGSGDPWATAVPGAYGAGTAGHTLGTYIDATITSRMATYTQPTGFLAATFPVTVASTTNITAASGVVLSSAGVRAIWTDDHTGVAFMTESPGWYINDIHTDLNVLKGDWDNGGRLDLILDARSSQTSVDAMAVIANKIGSVVFGTVTGAGTSTEVFVGAGITTTVTVDVDGNRSAVVFS